MSAPLPPTVVWRPQAGPQQRLLTCPVEDVFFGGARGGGKTDALLGDWIGHAGRYGAHAKGILFRRTMPELEDVISRSRQLFVPLGAEFKEQQKTWIFPNGAELRLRYLDRDPDADHYQGHAYTWMAFDEAGNWPTPAPIDKLRACLRSANGVPCVLRLTGNPGGPGHEWLKQRYVDPAPAGKIHKDANGISRVYIPSRVQDNRILMESDPGYVKRLESSGPVHLVKAWLNGDWNIVPDGGFFNLERIVRAATVPDLGSLCQAWDVAVSDESRKSNDPSACATGGFDSLGRFWLVDIHRGWWDSDQLADEIYGQYLAWNPVEVYIEGGPIGLAVDGIMKRRGQVRGYIPYELQQTKGRDKAARAAPIRAIISAGAMSVPADAGWLRAFLDEMASFPLEQPHDDQVDALAWLGLNQAKMLNHREQEKPKFKSPDKKRWDEIEKRGKTGSGAIVKPLFGG